MKHNFIRNHVLNRYIEISFIRTDFRLTDIFTKPLFEQRFSFSPKIFKYHWGSVKLLKLLRALIACSFTFFSAALFMVFPLFILFPFLSTFLFTPFLLFVLLTISSFLAVKSCHVSSSSCVLCCLSLFCVLSYSLILILCFSL